MTDEAHKILVVEDERPLLEVIKQKLEAKGLEVVTARDAEQAIDYMVNNMEVHAIWLDHYLLGQDDGLSLLAKIKDEGSNWHDIPVFVVSNTAGAETVQSYLRLGVEKYFTKSDNRLEEIVSDVVTYLKTGETAGETHEGRA